MAKKKTTAEAAAELTVNYSIDDDEIQVSRNEEEEVLPEEIENTQKYQKNHSYKMLYKPTKRGRYASAVCYPEDFYSRLNTQDPEVVRAHILKMFENTGLKVALSPLHDKDFNGDGTPKKLHFHIIVVYSGSTTYKVMCENIQRITDGPFPIMISSVKGMYDYLTHKNNPEKAQYSNIDILSCNGFVVPIGTAEESAIMNELEDYIITHDCQSFMRLFYKFKYYNEYRQVLERHDRFFDRLINGYTHNIRDAVEAYVEYGKENGMALREQEELLNSIPGREAKFEDYMQRAENLRSRRLIAGKYAAADLEAEYESFKCGKIEEFGYKYLDKIDYNLQEDKKDDH